METLRAHYRAQQEDTLDASLGVPRLPDYSLCKQVPWIGAIDPIGPVIV
jgi:hypothetical protein